MKMHHYILRGLLICSLLFFCFSINSHISVELYKSKFVPSKSDSIKSKTLFHNDFEIGDLSNWKIIDDVIGESSNWYIERGFLIQDTDIGNTKELIGTHIISGDGTWDNYVIRANVICTDDDYIGVLFRYQDRNNYYRVIISSERETIRLDKKVSGKNVELASFSGEEWPTCNFSITVFLKSDSIIVYLNDRKFFNVSDDQFNKGKIGFTSISNLGSFFDDITVYTDYELNQSNSENSIVRGPYLQNILADSAVIRWNTNFNCSSMVELGFDNKTQWKISKPELSKTHEVVLKNLITGSNYYYRIVYGNKISDWYSFKTAIAEESSFSFIVYGDNQLNFLRHSDIVEQIKKHNFDFIISCGDVVQRGPRDDWDTEFFNPLKEILAVKPIYCAIGNHELNSRNYYQYFSNPAPEHESFYSFKYSNCFFVFIDNPLAGYPNRTLYNDFKPESIQYNWLENQLSSKEAQESDWIIVISHIPSYVFGMQDFFLDCRKYLVPLFEKYNVDFNFSGHVHGYEKGKVNGVNYVVTAGGGGALNKYDMAKLKKLFRFNITYNYCYITVKNKALSMQAYDINGNLIDEVFIEKNN